MSFKQYLREEEFREFRFHDFFNKIRKEKKQGAVYFGKHGWFDVYLLLETPKEFVYYRAKPGDIIQDAWPEGSYLKVSDACEKISNTAQKAGMKKQKGTVFVAYPKDDEFGRALRSYRITVISKLALKKSNQTIIDTIAHEWAHTVLFNLPSAVKEEFKRFVDWHRNRLSNSFQIPLKDLPDDGDTYENRNPGIKSAMEQYAEYNKLPWDYCLLNGDEMWAVCVETLISGESLSQTLKQKVIKALYITPEEKDKNSS